MIERTAQLSVSRQAILLGISRGSIYYQNRPVSDADLKLMHRIDKLHTEFPFAGSRMLRDLLAQEGFKVGRLYQFALRLTREGFPYLVFCDSYVDAPYGKGCFSRALIGCFHMSGLFVR